MAAAASSASSTSSAAAALSDIEKIKAKDCAKRYLTKKYSSLSDLQQDNNTDEVFYDNEFDDTVYEIMKNYKNEKKNMSDEDFLEFLTESLIQKHSAPEVSAKDIAKTLILGKKRVQDGEYAVLEYRPKLPSTIDEKTLTDKEKEEMEIEMNARTTYQYYLRKKNVWVLDKDIDMEGFVDTNTLFCNIKSGCFKNEKTKNCESSEFTKDRLKEITKSRLVKEFENRIDFSIEKMTETLKKNI
jgi:hypothetical protein